jgi:hypothetical protein
MSLRPRRANTSRQAEYSRRHTWLVFQGRNPSLETMYHVPIGMYQTLHTTGKDVHVLYILKMDAWTDDLVRTYLPFPGEAFSF